VWDYVTDWPRQGEWVPASTVQAVAGGNRLGGRLRAWTGVGPVGFWDSMTITSWVRPIEDGDGRCDVLHTGRVVRGDGGFAVEHRGPSYSSFSWWERVELPGGRLGGALAAATRPLGSRVLGLVLRRMAARVVEEQRGR